MWVSSAYILGMLNDRQADCYYKLEIEEDQGLFPVAPHSGEVRETAINGAPLCAISKIR